MDSGIPQSLPYLQTSLDTYQRHWRKSNNIFPLVNSQDMEVELEDTFFKTHHSSNPVSKAPKCLGVDLFSVYLKGQCFFSSPTTSRVWKNTRRLGNVFMKGKRRSANRKRRSWEPSAMKTQEWQGGGEDEGLARTETLTTEKAWWLPGAAAWREHPVLWLPPLHSWLCSNSLRRPGFILKCLANGVCCQEGGKYSSPCDGTESWGRTTAWVNANETKKDN